MLLVLKSGLANKTSRYSNESMRPHRCVLPPAESLTTDKYARACPSTTSKVPLPGSIYIDSSLVPQESTPKLAMWIMSNYFNDLCNLVNVVYGHTWACVVDELVNAIKSSHQRLPWPVVGHYQQQHISTSIGYIYCSSHSHRLLSFHNLTCLNVGLTIIVTRNNHGEVMNSRIYWCTHTQLFHVHYT